MYSDTRSQVGDIDYSVRKYLANGWTLALGPARDDEKSSLERELAEARACLKLWVQGG